MGRPGLTQQGNSFRGIVVSMKEYRAGGVVLNVCVEKRKYSDEDFAPLLSYKRYDWSLHEHLEHSPEQAIP